MPPKKTPAKKTTTKSARPAVKKTAGKPRVHVEEVVGIDCDVMPGMFTNERGVRFKLADGTEATVIVSASTVAVKRPFVENQEAPGKLLAYVVEKRKDTLVLDLPQPTLQGGPRVEVSKSLVQS